MNLLLFLIFIKMETIIIEIRDNIHNIYNNYKNKGEFIGVNWNTSSVSRELLRNEFVRFCDDLVSSCNGHLSRCVDGYCIILKCFDISFRILFTAIDEDEINIDISVKLDATDFREFYMSSSGVLNYNSGSDADTDDNWDD